ncbi:hypothetical protein GJ744_010345 [Endocarpon pusillum]|uniref:GrpE protein homolog, mitochondrial n=1 Tax=Endocarpon pusillum TaxID=364733 RepID=A0A8H7AGA8_9EURO|nr:hypothetical protein GJ744_010345 [Endocarpon pusillum]
MIRRTILRQSRTLTASASSRSLCTPCSTSRLELRKRPLQPSSLKTVSPRLFQRWQSTETERKPEDDTAPAEDAQAAQAAPAAEAEKEDALKKELEAKSREIIDLKDKYLRSVADFRNLQERTKRDVESARQFAIQRFAVDLVESIDNLDRALEAVPQESLRPAAEDDSAAADSATTPAPAPNKDLINLHAGLKMTESILMSTLKKHGLERFDPAEEGRRFDPRLDEATFMTKVEGKEDGDVFHTQSKGFTLNGRVLRAAKVGVVKNS